MINPGTIASAIQAAGLSGLGAIVQNIVQIGINLNILL